MLSGVFDGKRKATIVNRPQKRGFLQIFALRYISNSFIFSLSPPHMLPWFGATWYCTSLSDHIMILIELQSVLGIVSMGLLWALSKIERLYVNVVTCKS